MRQTREKAPTPEQEAAWKAQRKAMQSCDWCGGNGWVFINEHWTYPVGSTIRDERNREVKRETHNRAEIGKRWSDDERGLCHEVREAGLPCQCKA